MSKHSLVGLTFCLIHVLLSFFVPSSDDTSCCSLSFWRVTLGKAKPRYKGLGQEAKRLVWAQAPKAGEIEEIRRRIRRVDDWRTTGQML